MQHEELTEETMKTIHSVLNEAHPPTNPAVLLRAAYAWYLVKGDGSVLRALVDWLVQVTHTVPLDLDNYKSARKQFEEVYVSLVGVSDAT